MKLTMKLKMKLTIKSTIKLIIKLTIKYINLTFCTSSRNTCRKQYAMHSKDNKINPIYIGRLTLFKSTLIYLLSCALNLFTQAIELYTYLFLLKRGYKSMSCFSGTMKVAIFWITSYHEWNNMQTT